MLARRAAALEGAAPHVAAQDPAAGEALRADLFEVLHAARPGIDDLALHVAPHRLAIEWEHFGRGIEQATPTVEKTNYLKSEF